MEGADKKEAVAAEEQEAKQGRSGKKRKQRREHREEKILETFDLNKLKKIDRGTREPGDTAKQGAEGKFVYTPRKLKSSARKKKDFNQKIVNRIKKITTRYGHKS